AASQDQIDWVLTSYIVAAAIATPLTGFLTARLGLKRLFIVSVVGFTVASMLCGVGYGGDGGAHPGAGTGWLADRGLQLAMGVLHQPADRGGHLHRHDRLPAG